MKNNVINEPEDQQIKTQTTESTELNQDESNVNDLELNDPQNSSHSEEEIRMFVLNQM